MRISRKAQYALRAMVQLAGRSGRTNASIEELSVAGNIPIKFLEQILLILRKADLVRSKRGVGGGYQLNRAATDISLAEILRSIDGPFHPIGCTTPEPGKFGSRACECGVPGGCGLGRTFTDLQVLVNGFLEGTRLADVLTRGSSREVMHFDI